MMRNQTPQANQWVFLLLASAAIMNANCDSSSTGVSHADLQALARSLEKNPELATRADGGGATLLHHTAAKGDAQAAMLLLDTGAPMSSKDGWGYTPLHWAADAGAVETAKLLLSRGIAPDAGAMNGQTPLHRAAWGGSADMVKLLLSAGADVSVTDYRDFTPLHYARSAQAAQALLDGDAIINARPNNYSMTPLAAAAQRGDFKVVKFLLHQGADQTLADDMACTPLHWAAWAGDADSVKLLLTKSELTPDKSGRTVLDYAACRGHQQVVDLLSAHN